MRTFKRDERFEQEHDLKPFSGRNNASWINCPCSMVRTQRRAVGDGGIRVVGNGRRQIGPAEGGGASSNRDPLDSPLRIAGGRADRRGGARRRGHQDLHGAALAHLIREDCATSSKPSATGVI